MSFIWLKLNYFHVILIWLGGSFHTFEVVKVDLTAKIFEALSRSLFKLVWHPAEFF
jgi:hypothetical protein